MNQGDVDRLLRAGVEGLPDRDLTVGVWARSRHRRRVRRTAAVLGAVTAASALVVVSAVAASDDAPRQRDNLAPASSAPTSSEPADAARLCERHPDDCSLSGIVEPRVVQERWRQSRVDTLPWSDTNVPRRLDVESAVSLSDDPVQAAVLALERPRNQGGELFLLGTDGRWRLVDSPRLVPAADALGYGSSSLQPTSLSADGQMLAIPQPQSIVVVDLTTGDHRRYDVPGFNKTAIWSPDGDQLLSTTERSKRGRLLNLRDGSLSDAAYSGMSSTTTFTPDGAAVELREVSGGAATPWEMRTYGDGETRTVPLSVDVFTNFYTTATAGSADRLAFVRDVTGWSIPRGRTELRGLMVVDRDTGANLAQLPMSYGLALATAPVGWLDSETLLLRVGDDVLAWEFETGELQRITTMDGPAPSRAPRR